MFARVLALLPLAVLVSASTCSTGTQQCCNQVLDQNAAVEQFGASVLDVLDSVFASVGVDCVDIVGDACSQQVACCNNVSMNGLVNVGCNAIAA